MFYCKGIYSHSWCNALLLFSVQIWRVWFVWAQDCVADESSASTPYKPWNKCSIIKLGGRFFSRSGGNAMKAIWTFPSSRSSKTDCVCCIDDWFSALTILASERDLVDGLNTDEITDRFALLSDKLQKYLSC